MEDRLKEILDCKVPEYVNHPRMSRLNRAAQFAAFAALNGYGESIEKTKDEAIKRIKDMESGIDFEEAP